MFQRNSLPLKQTIGSGHSSSELFMKNKMLHFVRSDRKSLRQLIATGPIERGLYVASEERALVPRVQELLVDLLWKYSLQNSGEIMPDPMVSSVNHFSRRTSQIGQIIWVDSGNIFDPYRLSVLARQRGLEPLRILRAIKVGRPFTAYQFQQMLERVPNPALWAYPEEETSLNQALPTLFSRSTPTEFRSPSAVWWTPLVIISDLMGLFYDPELPEKDLQRAFREFLVRLEHLKRRAIVLALLREHQVPAHRRHLLAEVLPLCHRLHPDERDVVSSDPTMPSLLSGQRM